MLVNLHMLAIPFLFILLDILSGVTQAVKNKTLSSQVMREGIYHKLGYVLVIALAMLCEWSMQYLELGFTAPITIPCVVMICLTEIVSIIENVEKITPELAKTGIFELLSQNKKRRFDDDDENREVH